MSLYFDSLAPVVTDVAIPCQGLGLTLWDQLQLHSLGSRFHVPLVLDLDNAGSMFAWGNFLLPQEADFVENLVLLLFPYSCLVSKYHRQVLMHCLFLLLSEKIPAPHHYAYFCALSKSHGITEPNKRVILCGGKITHDLSRIMMCGASKMSCN